MRLKSLIIEFAFFLIGTSLYLLGTQKDILIDFINNNISSSIHKRTLDIFILLTLLTGIVIMSFYPIINSYIYRYKHKQYLKLAHATSPSFFETIANSLSVDKRNINFYIFYQFGLCMKYFKFSKLEGVKFKPYNLKIRVSKRMENDSGRGNEDDEKFFNFFHECYYKLFEKRKRYCFQHENETINNNLIYISNEDIFSIQKYSCDSNERQFFKNISFMAGCVNVMNNNRFRCIGIIAYDGNKSLKLDNETLVYIGNKIDDFLISYYEGEII